MAAPVADTALVPVGNRSISGRAVAERLETRTLSLTATSQSKFGQVLGPHSLWEMIDWLGRHSWFLLLLGPG